MEINLQTLQVLVLLALTAGCTQDIPESSSRNPEPTSALPASQDAEASSVRGVGSESTKDMSRVELLPTMRLPGLTSIERAISWEARLSQLPKAEQEYVNGKNSQYLDTLRFSSAEEQRKLIEQGFPMPEEWIEARRLPDGELQRLAKGGNLKAQMFYVDRVIDEVAPILRERGFSDSPEERALYKKFNEASAMSSVLLRQTRSPFAAYQNGLILSVGTQGHSPAIVAGSFQVAKELGDTRADFLSQTFYQRNVGLDPQAVVASYSSIKSALGR